MGRKWTKGQERRLREALTLAAQQQSEARRLAIALEECGLQLDRARSAQDDAIGLDFALVASTEEVERLRGVIERAAIGRDRISPAAVAMQSDALDSAIIARNAAIEERDEAKRALALMQRDAPAFIVPKQGELLRLMLRDGGERLLTIKSVAPRGDYGFEIRFEDEQEGPLFPGWNREPLVPETKEAYLRRRGWTQVPDGWERRDPVNKGWTHVVSSTEGAYKIQSDEDSCGPIESGLDFLLRRGWTLHAGGGEALWQHPDGGDDRYSEASAVALERAGMGRVT